MSIEIPESKLENLFKCVLEGNYRKAEEELFAFFREKAAKVCEDVINQAVNSEQGKEIVKRLRDRYGYRHIRKIKVQAVVMGGNTITVDSWYGLSKEKKKGRPKKGRNGTGTHVFLSYLGFVGKRSPGYVNQVAREGVACDSYELASQSLALGGIKLTDVGVKYLIEEVGEKAVKIGANLLLEKAESVKDKRIAISLDGGRIRTRVKKVGRHRKKKVLAGFDTPWREPKLLVIYELDEKGQKRRDSKPIYQATMQEPSYLYETMKTLCSTLHVSDAAQIVCIADGSDWIWNMFKKLINELSLTDKVVCVADYYHAIEHLTQIGELTNKSEKEKQEWVRLLSGYLLKGRFDLVENLITMESQKNSNPNILKKFSYFKDRQNNMHYNEYESKHIPIGSGTVESAIKRVINHKLKSPGIFWKIENIDKMLFLRCALMSGRWNSFMNNFLLAYQINY